MDQNEDVQQYSCISTHYYDGNMGSGWFVKYVVKMGYSNLEIFGLHYEGGKVWL